MATKSSSSSSSSSLVVMFLLIIVISLSSLPLASNSYNNNNNHLAHLLPSSYKLVVQWGNSFCNSLTVPFRCQSPVPQEFTVHGLWGYDSSGNILPDCQGGLPLLPRHLVGNNNNDLVMELDRIWVNHLHGRDNFGLHNRQWRKHGRCLGLTPFEYFERVIHLMAQIHLHLLRGRTLVQVFITGGLRPSNEVTYEPQWFPQEMMDWSGKVIEINCNLDASTGMVQLYEVRFCVSLHWQVIDCPTITTRSGHHRYVASNCYPYAAASAGNMLFPDVTPPPPPPPPPQKRKRPPRQQRPPKSPLQSPPPPPPRAPPMVKTFAQVLLCRLSSHTWENNNNKVSNPSTPLITSKFLSLPSSAVAPPPIPSPLPHPPPLPLPLRHPPPLVASSGYPTAPTPPIRSTSSTFLPPPVRLSTLRPPRPFLIFGPKQITTTASSSLSSSLAVAAAWLKRLRSIAGVNLPWVLSSLRPIDATQSSSYETLLSGWEIFEAAMDMGRMCLKMASRTSKKVYRAFALLLKCAGLFRTWKHHLGREKKPSKASRRRSGQSRRRTYR